VILSIVSLATRRYSLLVLALADAALLIVANVEYTHHRHVSDAAWIAFIIGVVALLVLVVLRVMQSRRSRPR